MYIYYFLLSNVYDYCIFQSIRFGIRLGKSDFIALDLLFIEEQIVVCSCMMSMCWHPLRTLRNGGMDFWCRLDDLMLNLCHEILNISHILYIWLTYFYVKTLYIFDIFWIFEYNGKELPCFLVQKKLKRSKNYTENQGESDCV